MRPAPLTLSAAIAVAAAVGFWAGRHSAPSSMKAGGAAGHPPPAQRESATRPTALVSTSTGGTKAARDTGAPPAISEPADLLDGAVQRSFEELNRRVAEMSPGEIATLLVELREGGGHPQQALIESILTFQLMGRDPEAMLDLKVAYPDLPVLGSTYRTWAQTDPVAALAHVRDLENETWYQQGLQAIFSGLGAAEPERAFTALLGMPEARPRHYQSVFVSWATRSPADAAAAVDRVPEPFRHAALASIADNWPEVDPEAAGAWIEGLDDVQASIARPVFEARMAQLENR